MSSVSETLPIANARRWPPALTALFLHLLAWLPLIPLLLLGWPIALLAVIQGAAVLLLSRWRGLPGWWQVINALFFPVAWLVSGVDIEPAWYLGAFILLALTSIGSLKTRVPLFLSSRQAVAAVAARAPKGAHILDLGCGLGGWLSALGEARPDLRLYGVEMAPFNWLVSRLRLRGRAFIRLSSLWNEDLSGYDLVYAYLSPAPMADLWQKVAREMRPGSLFVSNTFPVPGVEPDETVELHDLSHARLLIWLR